MTNPNYTLRHYLDMLAYWYPKIWREKPLYPYRLAKDLYLGRRQRIRDAKTCTWRAKDLNRVIDAIPMTLVTDEYGDLKEVITPGKTVIIKEDIWIKNTQNST